MIRRVALAVPIVCLVLTSASAQDKPAWKTFTSKEGRFSVLLPGEPKETKQNIGSADKMVIQTQYLIEQGNLGYLVSFQDTPGLEKPEMHAKVLDNGRDGAVKNLNGKLLSETKLTLDKKYIGLECLIDVPKFKGLYRLRMFIVGDRLYQLVVLGPKEVVTSKESDQYLDSFQLTK